MLETANGNALGLFERVFDGTFNATKWRCNSCSKIKP